jgi:hypothetical protein
VSIGVFRPRKSEKACYFMGSPGGKHVVGNVRIADRGVSIASAALFGPMVHRPSRSAARISAGPVDRRDRMIPALNRPRFSANETKTHKVFDSNGHQNYQ